MWSSWSSPEASSAGYVVDGDYDTIWKSEEQSSELIIQFKELLSLSSIEIFPEDYLSGFPSIQLSYSDDGISWSDLESKRKGINGFSLPNKPIRWIKINSGIKEYGIRELLFYGS